MASSIQSSCKANKEVNCMFLNELVEGSGGPITVMVCRKWDVNNVNGHYMSTDFIVSDKKANVMHCTAKNNIAHCFIDRLHKGSLYALRGFTVLPNKSEYRIMKDSPYIIGLQGSTIVSKVNDDTTDFVRHPFQLVDLETLKPTEGKFLVDVVGYVASLGHPSKASNGRQTLEFRLTNERGQHVRVTLWGELGNQLLEKNKNQPAIHSLILTSMSAKYYLGDMSLASSSSTLVLNNDDIPALQNFKLSLSAMDRPIERRPIVQERPSVTTIAGLLRWSREKKHEVAAFKGEVEITNIRTKNSWFNFTCTSRKCRKGVSRRTGSYWCDSCETNVAFPRPRFRLQVDVKDESAATVVVLFDETAEQLTHTTAKALLDEQNADDNIDGSALPYVLENLLHTKHTFELRSHTYYHYGEYESFNCARVILAEADKKVLEVGSGYDSRGSKSILGTPSKTVKETPSVVTPAKNSETKKRRKFVVESEGEDSSAPGGDNLEISNTLPKNRFNKKKTDNNDVHI